MTIVPTCPSYSGDNLRLYAHKQKLHVELNKAQIASLDLQPHHTVLDIGCSDGSLSELIAPLVSRVLGVDLSEEWIANARAKFAGEMRLEFAVADARFFVAHRPYDRVLLSMVCLSLPTQADLERLFASAYASLKSGGVMVFSDLHPDVMTRANWYNIREIELRDNFDLGIPGNTYLTRIQVLPRKWLEIENVSWFSLYAQKFWEKFGFLLKETVDVPFYVPVFLGAPSQTAAEYKIWILTKP